MPASSEKTGTKNSIYCIIKYILIINASQKIRGVSDLLLLEDKQMETLEQQIQPFIQPLIARIEVLEADNKQLKEAVAKN